MDFLSQESHGGLPELESLPSHRSVELHAAGIVLLFHQFHRLTTFITHQSITPSLFHSRLKTFSFSANPSHCAFLFFFRTDPTNSPDC